MTRVTSSRPRRSCRFPGYSCNIICILAALLALTPASQSATNDSYSYRDSKFIYTPKNEWHLDDAGANIAYTNHTGAKMSFNFFGSAVYLSSSKKADRYLLQVIIDDVDKFDVNLNGPDNTDHAPQEVVWGVGLVEGNHTLQAINLGADPERPYVAIAAITITKGQLTNNAPEVSSKPFHSQAEEDDDHAQRNAIIRRATGAVGALAGFIALVVLAYGAQRRRHRRQLQQHLHNHLIAKQQLEAPSPPEPVMHAPAETFHYVTIRPESSPRTIPTHNLMEPAESLLIAPGSSTPSDKEDESEFWRPRNPSNSPN